MIIRQHRHSLLDKTSRICSRCKPYDEHSAPKVYKACKLLGFLKTRINLPGGTLHPDELTSEVLVDAASTGYEETGDPQLDRTDKARDLELHDRVPRIAVEMPDNNFDTANITVRPHHYGDVRSGNFPSDKEQY